MREEGVCAQTLRRTDRQAGRQTDTEYPGCGQCAEDKKFNTISCTKRNWKRIYTARVGHSCWYLYYGANATENITLLRVTLLLLKVGALLFFAVLRV